MGQIAIPIGIDIDAVKQVFGSKDELLFNSILQSETYKKFDEEFSFKRELYDIIFNYIPIENRIIKPSKFFGLIKGNSGHGFEGDWNDYGHALLTICCHVGTKFTMSESDFICDDSWLQINTLLRENRSRFDLSHMLESKQIFDTPFKKDDICTSYCSKIEVKEFLRNLTMIENKIEYDSIKLFNSLKNGLLYCEENKLDVITFSYEFGDL